MKRSDPALPFFVDEYIDRCLEEAFGPVELSLIEHPLAHHPGARPGEHFGIGKYPGATFTGLIATN